MNKKTILVTGANGQLGSELHQLSKRNTPFNWLFCSSSQLDITNIEMLQNYFNTQSIDAVINAAAYTKVDAAETDQQSAIATNATAVEHLAKICSHQNILLLHISTDYVFDGNHKTPYLPADATSPVGMYAFSKWKGEEILKQYVAENQLRAILVLTSWVFSSYGNNFLKTMLRLMNDQIGKPTYAFDLAEALIKICQQILLDGKYNFTNTLPVYHFANKGIISWFDFALGIAQQIGYKGNLLPIPTALYPTPAKRPKYSVLDTTSFEADFNLQIPTWQQSLNNCIKAIHEK